MNFVNYFPLTVSIPLTTSSHVFKISLYVLFCSSQLLICARFINIRDGVCYYVLWHLAFWQVFASVFREPAIFYKRVILNGTMMQTSNVIQKKCWSQRVLGFIFIPFWMFVLIRSLTFVLIYVFLILSKIMSLHSLFLDRKITQRRIELWEGRPIIYLI
jgi:hypothetical protein